MKHKKQIEKGYMKGLAIISAFQEYKELRAAGKISDRIAQVKLTDEDRKTLEKDVVLTEWYDIDCYDRLCRLLWVINGGASFRNYMIQRGFVGTQRIIAANIYPQFKRLDEIREKRVYSSIRNREQIYNEYVKNLQLTASILDSLLRKATLEIKKNPHYDDRIVIDYTDNGVFNEAICLLMQGFWNAVHEAHTGGGEIWRVYRKQPDVVAAEMTRSMFEDILD